MNNRNINDLVRKNLGLIICLAVLIVLFVCLFNVEMIVTSIYGEPENPFDFIRATEEQHVIEGVIVHVEYIDWETCKLVMDDSWTYTFHGSDYGRLKSNEGRCVRIVCFTQGWDGKYRTYPCNDIDVFEIKEYGVFPKEVLQS